MAAIMDELPSMDWFTACTGPPLSLTAGHVGRVVDRQAAQDDQVVEALPTLRARACAGVAAGLTVGITSRRHQSAVMSRVWAACAQETFTQITVIVACNAPAGEP